MLITSLIFSIGGHLFAYFLSLNMQENFYTLFKKWLQSKYKFTDDEVNELYSSAVNLKHSARWLNEFSKSRFNKYLSRRQTGYIKKKCIEIVNYLASVPPPQNKKPKE